MAYSERELIARIVQCEAGGEGDNGMKAVATVVMNRVNASEGEYSRVSQGGNIRNIIFQQGQFDCARETINYQYNPQTIYNMTPTEVHYQIADWALSGNRLNEIGEELSLKYNINYLYADFKKKNGYKRSIELSHIYNLYRQDYCGCIYSKVERLNKENEKLSDREKNS